MVVPVSYIGKTSCRVMLVSSDQCYTKKIARMLIAVPDLISRKRSHASFVRYA
jgi:hypothetical protein